MERLQQIDPFVAVGIGLISFGINFIGTAEIQSIQNREALKAGLASASGVLLGSVLMYAFISDPLYAVPEMIGAFAGTYIQAKRGKPTIIP